jgi:hypothetical protein
VYLLSLNLILSRKMRKTAFDRKVARKTIAAKIAREVEPVAA